MSKDKQEKPARRQEITLVTFASPVRLPGESTTMSNVAVPGRGLRIDRAEDSAGVCFGVALTRGEYVVVVPWGNIKSVASSLSEP